MDKKIPKSKLARRSRTTGIISLFVSWIPVLGWAIVAYSMISGLNALNDINEKGISKKDKKIAKTGIILAIISLVLIPIELILYGLFFA
jgi:hypothetical protein